ncbi:histidine-rich glycoprotein [Drosophila biarmipes]|uniref:histidine-rich glycoprotein n=1 Tax=Drosophila biarmipes TaxID=125945 RepID=UPI0007E78632|nr:histidine-rich glycoprotein [Drosophila biarmipes]
MLKAIIVLATILVAVALATQPLEENEWSHHLNHKRQLSQHHHKPQEARHSAKEHVSHGKQVHQVVSHLKEHKDHAHGKSTSPRKSRQANKKEQGHKRSHHQKEHHKHQESHSRKARSHSGGSQHHHKRHAGSRRH